jgi:hypothetical protein
MAALLRGDLKSYVCTHVFEGTRPVLLVSHEVDCAWCFLCGAMHADSADAYRVVGAGHLFGDDPTLHECADLPHGYEAERADVGEPWIRTKVADGAF